MLEIARDGEKADPLFLGHSGSNRQMSIPSPLNESTLHPDGWVGDQAALERARRYRMALKWGTGAFYLLLAASWLVRATSDSVAELVIWFVALLWLPASFLIPRSVSRAIGRKWSPRLELKERRILEQAEAKNTSGVVARWLKRDTDNSRSEGDGPSDKRMTSARLR